VEVEGNRRITQAACRQKEPLRFRPLPNIYTFFISALLLHSSSPARQYLLTLTWHSLLTVASHPDNWMECQKIEIPEEAEEEL